LNRQEESPQPAGPVPIAGLHRVLGTFDIVLLNVAAIISFRWLAVAAQVGPSSLAPWVLGLLTFFVPSALTILELNSRLPRHDRCRPDLLCARSPRGDRPCRGPAG
jgi:hypothetical protein